MCPWLRVAGLEGEARDSIVRSDEDVLQVESRAGVSRSVGRSFGGMEGGGHRREEGGGEGRELAKLPFLKNNYLY